MLFALVATRLAHLLDQVLQTAFRVRQLFRAPQVAQYDAQVFQVLQQLVRDLLLVNGAVGDG